MQYLNSDMLFPIIAAVIIFGYFAGSFMDSVLGPTAFGVLGNTGIMIAGAIIGEYAYGLAAPFNSDGVISAVAAISGAFIALFLCSVVKSVLVKRGY